MTPSSTGNGKALVTILIGEMHTAVWRQTMEGSWRRYAARHGYDIVVLDDYIDKTKRGLSRQRNWQKCLILEHERVRDYADVVWLDADIMINFHTAPCIVAHNGCDRIGLVSNKEAFLSSPATLDNLVRRYEGLTRDSKIRADYEKAGLSGDVDDSANTGVMVLKPKRHAEVLRHVYETYEENEHSAKEELPLSHHIYGNRLANNLDKRFNWPWFFHIVEHYPYLLESEVARDAYVIGLAVNAAWADSWFLHFTGDTVTGTRGEVQDLRAHAKLVAQPYNGLRSFQALREALRPAASI